jgi:uroporphyrinogen-III synthase
VSAGLAGLRVAVTRPRAQAAELGGLLEREEAEVLFAPLIDIVDPDSWVPVHDSMHGLARGHYAWVLFTSANTVSRYVAHLKQKGFAGHLSNARVGAVGSATEKELVQRGIQVAKVPEVFTGEALAEVIGRGSGYVLLPRGHGAPQDMVEVLEANGWIVDEVPVYRNVSVTEGPHVEELRSGRWDIVTLASASAARSFCEVADASALGVGRETKASRLVACIGAKTAAGAEAAGLRVDIVAQDPTATGLVRALVDHVSASGFSPER